MSEVSEQRAVAVPAKAAFSIDEFCQAHGVGRTLVYDEISAGRLKTRKAGRRTLIRAADAQAWLNELPAGSAA